MAGCWQRAYVGLGSNLGNRAAFLRGALAALDAEPGVRLMGVSPIYETDPVGVTDQPPFLNQVAELETVLTPDALLTRLLAIERAFGRERRVRWGPRTLDLDLLLYGDARIATERLCVPHPRMTERAFVLVPLADMAPDLVIPGTGRCVRDWVRLVGTKGVRRWKPIASETASAPTES